MEFFIEPLSEKDIFTFLIDKKASVDLSDNEPEMWREVIRKHIVYSHPHLSNGLRSVEFKKIDSNTGDAVGSVLWQGDGISVTIPIIVEEKSLKDIDVGIYQNRVIPLDETFLSLEASRKQNIGETEDTTDVSDEIEFLTDGGLFDVSEDEGIKIASTKETVERVKKLLDDERIALPEKYAKLIKEGKSKYDDKDIVMSIVKRENVDKPYHYIGAMLKKTSSNNFIVRDFDLSAEEMIKEAGLMTMGECNTCGTSEQSIAIRKDKKLNILPDLKLIDKTDRYNYIAINGGESGVAIYDPEKIWEQGGKPKTLAVVVDERRDSKPKWAYGDIYGGRGEGSEGGYNTLWISGEKPKDLADVNQRTIVFECGDSMTAPYFVEDVEDITIKEGRDVILYHMLSLTDKSRATVWVDSGIDKITQVNADKLHEKGLSVLAKNGRRVYLLPRTYRPMILQGEKVNVDGRDQYLTKLLRETSKEYTTKVAIDKIDAEDYKVVVANKGEKILDERLSKMGALVAVNYFTGENAKSIDDFRTEEPYFSKVAIDMGDEAIIKRDNMINKYRGSWIKTASILLDTSKDLWKEAEIETVINGLVSSEYADQKNIGEPEKLSEMLEKINNKIGQALLLARMSKTETSEPVLARAFKAITNLIKEIEGE